MIREWCEGCGERLTLQWSAMHCREFGRCPDRCGYDDRPTVGDVSEAFWTAIAHERASYESALRHMVGFGRGPVPASDAFLAEAPGIIVLQGTTKGEG